MTFKFKKMETLLTLIIFIGCGGCMNMNETFYFNQRKKLVDIHLKNLGIKDNNVLNTMRSVPRHEFVPEEFKELSYRNSPLPIGFGQTISQPYIVALMTEYAEIKQSDKVLEIGTGCGYQAAILSCLCKCVYTIEVIEPLAKKAQQTLKKLNYHNVYVRIGDGNKGWAEEAPFDAIIVTAAPQSTPIEFINQLKMGGRLIIPVGKEPYQKLLKITKKIDGIQEEYIAPVRFVPMI